MEILLTKIRKLAKPWAVEFCYHGSLGLLRLRLPDNLYFDAIPEVMLARLKNGLLPEVSELAARAHGLGWRFAPACWVGQRAAYLYFDDEGKQVGPLRLSRSMASRMLAEKGNFRHINSAAGDTVAPLTHEPAERRQSASESLGARGSPMLPRRHPRTSTGGKRVSSPRRSAEEEAPNRLVKKANAAAAHLKELAQLAAQKSLKLKTAHWAGPRAMYEFIAGDGKSIQLTPAELSADRTPADYLKRLALRATKQSLTLRSTDWSGHEASYEFLTQAGEVVILSPDQLWAYRTIQQRLNRLADRAAEKSLKLLSTDYSGATVSHEFLTKDGRVVRLTSEGLAKYDARDPHLQWLARVAQQKSLVLRSKEWSGSTALYEFLEEGIHVVELTPSTLTAYVPLRKRLENLARREEKNLRRAEREFRTLAGRASAKSLKLLSTRWLGPRACYGFLTDDGLVVQLTREELARYGAPDYRLQRLARRAVKKSLKLQSVDWMGPTARYEFLTEDGQVVELTPPELVKHDFPGRQLQKMAELGTVVEPGFQLMKTGWRGGAGCYPWKTSKGRVIVTSIAVLKHKSAHIGIEAQGSGTAGDVRTQVFRWTLPDGSVVEAPWPTFDAALQKVLGGNPGRGTVAGPFFLETGFSAKVKAELKLCEIRATPR